MRLVVDGRVLPNDVAVDPVSGGRGKSDGYILIVVSVLLSTKARANGLSAHDSPIPVMPADNRSRSTRGWL